MVAAFIQPVALANLRGNGFAGTGIYIARKCFGAMVTRRAAIARLHARVRLQSELHF